MTPLLRAPALMSVAVRQGKVGGTRVAACAPGGVCHHRAHRAPECGSDLPEHGKHANLIGKFDKDSLIEHETKFKEGKLPLQTVKVPLSDMKLSDITDCSAD